jgi:ribonuclease III
VSSLGELQQRLGYAFQDEGWLRLALTHPSMAHEAAGNVPHNQRLEFLGDAVLGLILTRELFDRFPQFGEGPLTKARAQMVNRSALAAQARQVELGGHLLLSRGEEATGGRDRISALADAFEAVVGAVFLDGGYEAARGFVLQRFHDALDELLEIPNLENPKGELQELLQAQSAEAPQYEIIAASGPDHNRDFECAVYHRGQELGRGQGKSKKEAESLAAEAALRQWRDPGDAPPETKA